ncbi:phosphatase PAP2 family protein [Pontibacter qinzhouensis]|uniref:Phosphatase PAP2 family protein n=1 Tax=Pontibacter qinzhouensis TaxID=2603253 RepID=A0A5C8J734_9BACT|nr:phosphatase PAP2 family protein [Pontibacter qinzhouensis]TXK31563.1 phosphatase PAP2 family protein [Pontibacter qinzhouensis]
MLSDKVRLAMQQLLQQPVVVRVQQRFPRAVRFLQNRFSTTSFTGLPLTLLLVVFLFNSMLLSQLTEEVVESDGVLGLDDKFTAMLYGVRSDWLSQTFYFLTQLGTRAAVFVVGALVTGLFLYKRRYVAILAFWLVMAGVGLSVQYGKTFISRNRPADVAYYPEHNYSFPSGHATTAMALFGMVAYFLCQHYRAPAQRRLIIAGAVLVIAGIGFTRIYLGVHFLTDVLAGYMLGALWLLLGISLTELMTYRSKRLAAKQQDPTSG